MQSTSHAAGPPERYFTGLIGLGAVLLFCAVADLTLGIANAVLCGLLGSVGYGIWGSVICLAAGISGIMAGSSRTRAAVVTCMVLSILAAVSGAVQLGMGAGSAVSDHAMFKDINNAGYNPYHYVNYNSSAAWLYFDYLGCSERQRAMHLTRWTGPTATDALLASFAAIQGIIAIIAAAFSCRASVCYPGATEMPWQIYGSHATLVSTGKV